MQEAKASPVEEQALEIFLGIVGERVTRDEASHALQDTKGDVQSAVNAFYDNQQKVQASQPKPSPKASLDTTANLIFTLNYGYTMRSLKSRLTFAPYHYNLIFSVWRDTCRETMFLPEIMVGSHSCDIQQAH